jgi:hypothetical protein
MAFGTLYQATLSRIPFVLFLPSTFKFYPDETFHNGCIHRVSTHQHAPFSSRSSNVLLQREKDRTSGLCRENPRPERSLCVQACRWQKGLLRGQSSRYARSFLRRTRRSKTRSVLLLRQSSR